MPSWSQSLLICEVMGLNQVSCRGFPPTTVDQGLSQQQGIAEKSSLLCRRRVRVEGSGGPANSDICERQLGKPVGRLPGQLESSQPALLLLNVGHVLWRAAAGPAGSQAHRAPFPLL